MSFLKSTLIASAMTMAYATGAVAQNLEAWDIRDRSAYVVMMDGSMKIVSYQWTSTNGGTFTNQTAVTDPATGGTLPPARPLFLRQSGGPSLLGPGTCS